MSRPVIYRRYYLSDLNKGDLFKFEKGTPLLKLISYDYITERLSYKNREGKFFNLRDIPDDYVLKRMPREQKINNQNRQGNSHDILRRYGLTDPFELSYIKNTKSVSKKRKFTTKKPIRKSSRQADYDDFGMGSILDIF